MVNRLPSGRKQGSRERRRALHIERDAVLLCLAMLSTLVQPSRLPASPETVFGDGSSRCVLRGVTYTEDLEAKDFRLRLVLEVSDRPMTATIKVEGKPMAVAVEHLTPITLAKNIHHLTFFYGGPSKFFWGRIADAEGKKAALIPMGAGVSYELHQGERFDEDVPYTLEIETALPHRIGGTDVPLIEWLERAKAEGTDLWLDSPMARSYYKDGTVFFKYQDDWTADVIAAYRQTQSNAPLKGLLDQEVVVTFWGDRFSHPSTGTCDYVLQGFRVKHEYTYEEPPPPPLPPVEESASDAKRSDRGLVHGLRSLLDSWSPSNIALAVRMRPLRFILAVLVVGVALLSVVGYRRVFSVEKRKALGARLRRLLRGHWRKPS